MTWFRAIKFLRQKRLQQNSVVTQRRRVALTEKCLTTIKNCLASDICKGHEGIAYLFGLTDGLTTLAISAIRPKAHTTRGSFDVDTTAMALVVRAATKHGLQVIGQVHTHPGEAYHSEGDEVGARIRYTGYVSIVLPDYGRWLPKLTGAAVYMFASGKGFVLVDSVDVTVVPERME